MKEFDDTIIDQVVDNPDPNKPPIKVSAAMIKAAETITCECGGEMWTQVTQMRKIPGPDLGTPQIEAHYFFTTKWMCLECHKLLPKRP